MGGRQLIRLQKGETLIYTLGQIQSIKCHLQLKSIQSQSMRLSKLVPLLLLVGIACAMPCTQQQSDYDKSESQEELLQKLPAKEQEHENKSMNRLENQQAMEQSGDDSDTDSRLAEMQKSWLNTLHKGIGLLRHFTRASKKSHKKHNKRAKKAHRQAKKHHQKHTNDEDNHGNEYEPDNNIIIMSDDGGRLAQLEKWLCEVNQGLKELKSTMLKTHID